MSRNVVRLLVIVHWLAWFVFLGLGCFAVAKLVNEGLERLAIAAGAVTIAWLLSSAVLLGAVSLICDIHEDAEAIRFKQ